MRKKKPLCLIKDALSSHGLVTRHHVGPHCVTSQKLRLSAQDSQADSLTEQSFSTGQNCTTCSSECQLCCPLGSNLSYTSRAPLADLCIPILDEATGSVDTRTERLIQRALEELLAGGGFYHNLYRSQPRYDAALASDDGREPAGVKEMRSADLSGADDKRTPRNEKWSRSVRLPGPLAYALPTER
jgi:hypothetical protein